MNPSNRNHPVTSAYASACVRKFQALPGLEPHRISCSNSPMRDNDEREGSAAAPVRWRQQLTLDLPDASPGCIWVHACSVGEVGSVVPLIRSLRHRGHEIHLSVITATGLAHAKRLLPGIGLSYLPWDLPGLMARFIDRLRPALLLLAETEFWPGMLKACARRKIPVVGINTRISDRSFPRYARTAFLWRRWLEPVSLFLAQSGLDAERLAAMGVDTSRIRVAGNLKYAVPRPEVDAAALRRRVDASGVRPILIAASTHEGEEQAILGMLNAWQRQRPDLLTLIVPRHPERFDAVAGLIRDRGFHVARWSSGDAPQQLLLVDAMGVLAGLYAIADLVFIGGSLADIGGHNPLEPAICGRGPVTGPHVQNFRDIYRDMQRHDAAIVCDSAAEVEAAITGLLKNPSQLRDLHAHAAAFMAERGDVLASVLAAIEPWLPERH